MEALIGLIDNVMGKLNDPNVDPAILASARVAIRHITEAIGEKGVDTTPLLQKIEATLGGSSEVPLPVMAMRLAMVMDHLRQYDLADRLETISKM